MGPLQRGYSPSPSPQGPPAAPQHWIQNDPHAPIVPHRGGTRSHGITDQRARHPAKRRAQTDPLPSHSQSNQNQKDKTSASRLQLPGQRAQESCERKRRAGSRAALAGLPRQDGAAITEQGWLGTRHSWALLLVTAQ